MPKYRSDGTTDGLGTVLARHRVLCEEQQRKYSNNRELINIVEVVESSVINNSSTPYILPGSTYSSTTSTIFISSLLLLYFLCCYSHQTLCLASTLPYPSFVPSLLSLGMNNSLPNPLFEASPVPYQARAILVGRIFFNGGYVSLINRSIT